ncbi:MAG: O-antigen ligase family protein [bacterium]
MGIIFWLVYIVAIGLVLVPPFFRGLFFPREQLIVHLVTLTIFILWWVRRWILGEVGFFRGPVSMAALALVASYGLSFFVAVNPRAAVGELLKNMNYFLLLWLVVELARERRDIALFLRVLVLAGVATTVLGIGAAAGTFSYKAAFEGGRLSSSFQYPNTFASYLVSIILIAVTIAVETPRVWEKPLFTGAAGLMFLAFLFTQSRGALLILPPAALILVLLSPRGTRAAVALNLVAAGVAALACAGPFGSALTTEGGGGALVWFWAMAAAALAAGLGLLIFLLQRFFPNAQGRRLGLGLASVFLVGLVLIMVKIGPEEFLPAHLAARFRTISLTTTSAAERLRWTADAFRIVLDHPILGAGGGGWEALYHQYQHYLYWSNQVHNHWLQTWVEVGTVGFLSFVALWGTALYAGLRVVLQGKEKNLQLVAAGILAAALNLGAHSFIDFNLSLSAVALTLWALLGLLEAVAFQCDLVPVSSLPARKAAWPGVVAVVLAAFSLAGTGSLLIGYNYGQQGAKFMEYNNIPFAIKRFEQALKYDPLTASYKIDLAQCLEKTAQKEEREDRKQKLTLRALDLMRKGQEQEPTNATYSALRAAMVFRYGLVDEGLYYAERAVELMPRRASDYENLAQAYVEVVRYFQKKGDDVRAEEILDKLAALPERIENLLANTPVELREEGRPPLSVTPRLQVYLGAGRYLAGEYQEAREILTPLTELKDTSIQAEARLWLGLAAAKEGDAATAKNLIEQALKARPELVSQLD